MMALIRSKIVLIFALIAMIIAFFAGFAFGRKHRKSVPKQQEVTKIVNYNYYFNDNSINSTNKLKRDYNIRIKSRPKSKNKN